MLGSVCAPVRFMRAAYSGLRFRAKNQEKGETKENMCVYMHIHVYIYIYQYRYINMYIYLIIHR